MKICSPSVIAIVHLLIIQCVSNITSQLWLSCGSLEGFWPSKPMSLVAVGKVISGSECLQGTDTAIEEDGEGWGEKGWGRGDRKSEEALITVDTICQNVWGFGERNSHSCKAMSRWESDRREGYRGRRGCLLEESRHWPTTLRQMSSSFLWVILFVPKVKEQGCLSLFPCWSEVTYLKCGIQMFVCWMTYSLHSIILSF